MPSQAKLDMCDGFSFCAKNVDSFRHLCYTNARKIRHYCKKNSNNLFQGGILVITKAEEQQLTDLLNRLGPNWSPELYEALAKKVVMTAIELIIFRQNGDRVEVLLVKRPETDRFYAGQ